MFPMLFDVMKGLTPEVYFGLEDVPPYAHIHVCRPTDLVDVVGTIRSIGNGVDASGYIDEEGVHFHLTGDDEIQVDLSKRFNFISQLSLPGTRMPSNWQVLRFLQEPVERAVYVGSGVATLIEKTEETLLLCRALDKTWASEAFVVTIQEMVLNETSRGRGLTHLMNRYEEETNGDPSPMWEFWETFSRFLMRDRLGLRVRELL
jgi:hypothetical protein